MAVTSDNASNNDTMLQTLQDEWIHDGVIFDAKKQHQRCFAHIINLGVNAAMSKLNMSDEELEETDQHLGLELEEDEDEDDHPPSLLEKMDARNIIQKVSHCKCYEFITNLNLLSFL